MLSHTRSTQNPQGKVLICRSTSHPRDRGIFWGEGHTWVHTEHILDSPSLGHTKASPTLIWLPGCSPEDQLLSVKCVAALGIRCHFITGCWPPSHLEKTSPLTPIQPPAAAHVYPPHYGKTQKVLFMFLLSRVSLLPFFSSAQSHPFPMPPSFYQI